MKPLDALQSTDFLALIGQTFFIRLEGIPPIPLELASVTELTGMARPGARLPFSLTFLGPVSPQYLAQNTYRFERDPSASVDLFIVPLGPQAGRMRYEAIIS